MSNVLTKAADSITAPLTAESPPSALPNAISTEIHSSTENLPSTEIHSSAEILQPIEDLPPTDPTPDPLIFLDSTSTAISTLNLQTRTRNLLIQTLLSNPLPPELILQILDHAHSYLCLPPTYLPQQKPPLRISDNRRHPGPDPSLGDEILLASPPLKCATIRHVRKITLTWISKDQGWSSYPQEHGTFDGSWTWFDAALQPAACPLPSPNPPPETSSLASPNPPPETSSLASSIPPPEAKSAAEGGTAQNHEDGSLVHGVPLKTRYRLQHNRHAGQEMETYRVELEREAGHAIFDEMEEGDRICLIASARFPGWTNLVEAASLLVWVVDDLRDDLVVEGEEGGAEKGEEGEEGGVVETC